MRKSCLFLLLCCGFLAGCSAIAPGGQAKKDRTATVQAFVDSNRDGKRNGGEAPLPDVLIAARSNIHGEMTYTAQLTDGEGESRITATYTHFFDLLALLPCGYTATTPTVIEARQKVAFGFAPLDPQPAVADFYLLFWHDENQDGVYQSGERPIAGEMLYLDPGLAWGNTPDIVAGPLAVQTNSGGEAVANLGNSCGEVTITIPTGWQPSSASGEGLWADGKYRAAYQPGRTNIFLGVIPDE